MRCGKSTQSRLLADRLCSELQADTKLLRFPNRESSTGEVIDKYLRGGHAIPDQAIHLLFAANRWEAMPDVEAKLKSGCCVVADRYAFSGVAYAEGAQGLCRSWCLSPDAGLLAPDVVVYLDLQPQQALERGEYGAEIYEKVSIQEKVYAAYKQFFSFPYWLVFDAARTEKELSDIIFAKISEVLTTSREATNSGAARRRLWE
eukprot:GHVS01085435.1.p1 GENE.GHVS01085435.1~~GHVS01085435.1.p1  ORF type:complete len:203 (+),score=27.14 GHVS01085435.1:262-870(+)